MQEEENATFVGNVANLKRNFGNGKQCPRQQQSEQQNWEEALA